MANGDFKYREVENVRVPKLNGLKRRVEALEARSKAVLPLVDGSVPAVFIQNPDGSLVYGEIE